MTKTVSPDIIKLMIEELPSYFPRSDVERLTNGLFGSLYMANLATQGLGPKVHRMGKRVYYLKTEFVAWVINHFEGMNYEFARPSARVCESKASADGVGTSGERDQGREGSGSEEADPS